MSTRLENPRTGGPLSPLDVSATPTAVISGQLALVHSSIGALQVDAPPFPVGDEAFAVEDADGNASTNNITVDGNGFLIDGAASFVIDEDNGIQCFVFDRGQWRRVLQRRAFEVPPSLIVIPAPATSGGGGGGVPPTRTLTAGDGMTGGGDLSANRTFDVVANADGSIVANANDIQVGVLATDAQHGDRGGGTLHAIGTGISPGFISPGMVNDLASLIASDVVAGDGLTGGGPIYATPTIDVGANADGSILVNADDIQVGVLATDAQHGLRGGGTQHANAIAAGAAGFMTGADKTKLDGIGAGAFKIGAAIYPVYTGGPYATIAAAIAAAVADGHTDANNAAYVLVSPKVGGWVEDIALSAGVHIQGVWGANEYAVRVVGKCSFTPAAATFQIVHVEGLYLQPGVGKAAVEIIGANAGDLYVRDCILDKGEVTAPNVLVNGAAASRLFIQDCIGNLAANGTAWDVESGTIRAVNCDISRGTAARGLKVGAAGIAQFFNVNLTSNGADVVNVASGGAFVFENVLLTQATAGNDGIVMAGTPPFPTGLMFQCLLNVAAGAGYVARGTGLLSHAANVYVANVKLQTPGLTLNPLAILGTPTP